MGLWQDLQFAVRLLIKDKGFTFVAVVALALGIGVNTTVFTFVNAVLIRGLPVDDPGSLMVIRSHDVVRDDDMGASYADFRDWSEATTSFMSLAAADGATMNLSDEGRPPERYVGNYISGHAFTLLGKRPVVGRGFLPDDDQPGAAPVVLLGHRVWINRYGGDSSVVGRAVRVNEIPSVVIGVMPEGFRFPQNADLWQPLHVIRDLESQPRSQHDLEVFGRLAPGATRAQAQAEFTAIAERLARDYPDTNKNIGALIMTFNERQNGGPIRAVFLALMGAVGFVLLIACANVANLLLARSAQRAREISVRVSLGASRTRIIRQLLVESLLLALLAGALGLGLSLIGVALFDAATQDVGRPYWIQFTLDGAVFGYLAVICLGTAVLFGLAPALHIARTDVNEVLKEGGRSGAAGVRVRRWSSGLIVAELALTLVLLAGAGFMMRSFLTLYQLDLGFDTSRLITMSLVLPDAKYPALEQRLAFYRQVQDQLGSQFRAVSVATSAPMQGGFSRHLTFDGRPAPPGEDPPTVTMIAIDPRYFETLGVAPLRGRTFTDADGLPGQETAIVNAQFAAKYLDSDAALGRRIVLSLDPAAGDPPPGIARSQTATVVAITPNIRQRGFTDTEPDAVVYVPFVTNPRGFLTLIARSDGDPQLLIPRIRDAMRAIDADLPLFDIRTMDEFLARDRWPFRIFGTMFGIFALIALLLSAVGLYAVTAYSVTQRTQEIGVRTALGAQSAQVVWLFVRRAVIHVGIGLAIGIAGAFGVGQIFESSELLVQVSGRDPITIGSIALLLAVVSIAAAMWPARRATRLDPVAALRGD